MDPAVTQYIADTIKEITGLDAKVVFSDASHHWIVYAQTPHKMNVLYPNLNYYKTYTIARNTGHQYNINLQNHEELKTKLKTIINDDIN